jgi:hypothetical protein
MNRILILCTVLLISVSAFGQAKKGSLKLVEEANEDDAPVVTGKAGVVEYDMKFKHGDFFDNPVILPHPNVKNTSAKKVRFMLTVALFDATGALVAASNQSSELDPNESTQLGSFLMYVQSFETWKTIASYQLTAFSEDIK